MCVIVQSSNCPVPLLKKYALACVNLQTLYLQEHKRAILVIFILHQGHGKLLYTYVLSFGYTSNICILLYPTNQ